MTENKIKIIIAATLTIASLCLLSLNKIIYAQMPLAQKLKGKILLQVEARGEAWYVNPIDQKRYYLGRPDDAFALMKDIGLGITDEDLKKIAVAEANFTGTDSDGDGLSDAIEAALGTDKNNPDTDGDGYGDKEELLSGYDPAGPGSLPLDPAKARSLAGQIVMQVEKNGEAWYVNPDNLKRYYMGRPADAFNLMRSLGLGITDKNLAAIERAAINPEFRTENIVKNYTAPAVNTASARIYSDPQNHYSFSYPAAWTIKKFEGNPNAVQLSDATKDFIIEKRGAITLNYFKTDGAFSDMNVFRIAAKGKSSTLTDGPKTIGDSAAYENSYEHELAYEKTTTLRKNDFEFLQISLITAKSNNDYYLGIYNNLLSSVEFTGSTCQTCR